MLSIVMRQNILDYNLFINVPTAIKDDNFLANMRGGGGPQCTLPPKKYYA